MRESLASVCGRSFISLVNTTCLSPPTGACLNRCCGPTGSGVNQGSLSHVEDKEKPGKRLFRRWKLTAEARRTKQLLSSLRNFSGLGTPADVSLPSCQGTVFPSRCPHNTPPTLSASIQPRNRRRRRRPLWEAAPRLQTLRQVLQEEGGPVSRYFTVSTSHRGVLHSVPSSETSV